MTKIAQSAIFMSFSRVVPPQFSCGCVETFVNKTDRTRNPNSRFFSSINANAMEGNWTELSAKFTCIAPLAHHCVTFVHVELLDNRTVR